MFDALARGVKLLQLYPVPLLLPAIVIAAAGAGINHALTGIMTGKFVHFLMTPLGLSINFLLTCGAFLCVANYVTRNEANGERPAIRNLFKSFEYPNYIGTLTGIFVRFVVTLAVAGTAGFLVVRFALGGLKAAHHPPFSSRIYVWAAIAIGILILSRWMLVIPLFVQSEGSLRSPFEISARAIQGHRTFAVAFTLLVEAICYPLVRWTLPLHPHLSEGTARYVPEVLELVAIHAFTATAWTYWMIVITLVAMRMQRHDEPLTATPLTVA